MKLGGILGGPQLTHPNRRGVLKMLGGAVVNPKISMGGVSEIAEVLGKRVPIIIDDCWDIGIWEIAQKASGKGNVIELLKDAARRSSFLGEVPICKGDSTENVMEWIHMVFDAQALGMYDRAQEAIVGLPEEILAQMEGEVTLSTHRPYILDDIVNFPDKMRDQNTYDDVDICRLDYYFPDIDVNGIAVEASMEFGEEGLSFYFEICQKVAGGFKSHVFFEDDPYKAAKIRKMGYEELKRILDTQGDFVEDRKHLDKKNTNNKYNFFLSTTSLTPVEFYKNGFATKIIRELQKQNSKILEAQYTP